MREREEDLVAFHLVMLYVHLTKDVFFSSFLGCDHILLEQHYMCVSAPPPPKTTNRDAKFELKSGSLNINFILDLFLHLLARMTTDSITIQRKHTHTWDVIVSVIIAHCSYCNPWNPFQVYTIFDTTHQVVIVWAYTFYRLNWRMVRRRWFTDLALKPSCLMAILVDLHIYIFISLICVYIVDCPWLYIYIYIVIRTMLDKDISVSSQKGAGGLDQILIQAFCTHLNLGMMVPLLWFSCTTCRHN